MYQYPPAPPPVPPPFYHVDPNTFRRDYSAKLAELTVNSRPIIQSLSMIAQEYSRWAGIVVQCIEAHIRRVSLFSTCLCSSCRVGRRLGHRIEDRAISEASYVLLACTTTSVLSLSEDTHKVVPAGASTLEACNICSVSLCCSVSFVPRFAD